MTTCLKLTQWQPRVVHPQIRSGSELALNYSLCFGPPFITRRKQSVAVYSAQDYFSFRAGPDLLANKTGYPAPTTHAVHIAVSNEE